MNKLIIINHEPYISAKRSMFFMDDFKKDGFDVEYWSVYRAMPYQKGIRYFSVEKANDVIYIDSFKELLAKVKIIDRDSIVILEVFFSWETLSLFWALKNKKLVKIDYFINTSTYFEVPYFKNVFNYLFQTTLRSFLEKIFRKIKNYILKIVNNVLKLNNYDLVFLTGSKIEAFYFKNKKKSLDYFDVSNFEISRNKEKIPGSKYIVFLDINLPDHPDLFRGNLNTVTKEVYFSKIKSFFESLESQTGYEVIVAAHPKSNYTSEFGKYKFLYNKTAELVAHSEFVLLHNSASLNLALLAKKPLVFFYFDFFLNSKNHLFTIYSSMGVVSKYFGCHFINIDKEGLLFLNELKFDMNKYDEYLNNVIFSKEFPKSNYQIVKESLLALD